MIDTAILAAIDARLRRALAEPSLHYRAFVAGGVSLGLVDDARAARLAEFDGFHVTPDAVVLDERLSNSDARTDAIAEVAFALRAEGALPAWRDEPYAAVTRFGEPPLFLVERGAARYFGLRTFAAHVNGVVEGQTTRMWLARRSADKAVDPAMLDNLVGGGIGAALGVLETVLKEAWEEAGISAALARTARAAGAVHSRRAMFDGLQRETLFVHDLSLPSGFVPANQDGEAVEHRLVDLDEAARTIAAADGPDEVTLDASLVVLDYLVRRGAFRPDQPGYGALNDLLHARR